MVAKAIFFPSIAYFIYTRVFCFYKAYKFYGSQEGVIMGEEDYPVIGSTIPLLRQQKKSRETGDNYFPMFR